MEGSEGRPAEAIALDALTGATTCRIATVGRRTGAPHEVPVWFAVAADGTIYAPVRHGHDSDWLRNALAADRVEVRHRRASWTGRPHVVEQAGELGVALDALADKYAQYASIIRQWRLDPPVIVALVLDG